MKRKFFAAFLSLCMVMSLVPMTALAAENKESANATAITTQEELQSALNTAASTKGTVTLTSNITVSDTGLSGYGSAAIVVPEGVTLDGAGHTITADTWTSANLYHVIGVMNTKADTTTIKDLTIMGNANTKSGIHAYNCEGTVNLTGVTIRNCGNAAVQINGAKVTAENLTTSGNAWGGVNVDKGSTNKTPSFTLSGENNNLTEPTKIWTELTSSETGDTQIITVPKTWKEMTSTIDGKTYYASEKDVAIWIGTTPYATLQDAASKATSGNTILLTGDITVTNSMESLKKNQAAVTLPADVTLDGNNHKIIAIADWDKTKNNHILGVVSPTNDVTIKDVIIVGNENTKHGINAYGTSNPNGKLNVQNVTIQNCGTAGMVVMGMTVVADGLTTSGNAWGAVNVDDAANSKLTLTNADLKEDVQVWTEMTEVPKDTISIEGTDFTMVTGAGKATDPSGLKGFTYYTTDLSKLGEASITTDGTTVYATLADAIKAAQDGDTVKLLKDVTVSDDNKGNTQGILTITKNITLDGNGKTITSKQSTSDSQKASMINVEGTKNVTIKNLTIDSAEKAKHGLNLYNAGQVNVENVTIKNGTGYGVVCSSSTLNATNLNTSGNGWGGINIDTKVNGVGSAFSMTSGTIQEKNSVYIENAQDEKISANISGGSFQNVSVANKDNSTEDVDNVMLTISGGRFANDVTDYLADGLVQDSNGNVEKPYTPPANPNYKITIGAMENGTVTANPTAAKAGATVTLTPVPDEGYALSTLTVTDRFGDAVRVTENSDGTYTFPMPNGQVTVTATFVETEEPVAEPFVDVAEGDWFYDAVVYAYQNELMDGVGGNRFAPNSETTRAQLVTILYRLEGEPAVSGDLPFTDVEAGIWYTDAILWAAQNNIVNGVTDTTFAPGDEITRQQLVTILYRYAEAKGYDVSASADLSGYPDAGQVQDYAQPAMAWAVAENIIQGMEDGTLKPAGNASRAQIATILMRFCEDVAQ